MLVYHGSNSSFKKLRISKSLVKHQSTMDNEGLGIYFSTDIEVAKSYGKYVYTLDINDNYLLDFRKESVCYSYLMHIRKNIMHDLHFDVTHYCNLTGLVNRLYCGGQAISGVGHELCMLLDSEYTFYQDFSSTTIQKIFAYLNRLDKNCPKAYLFTYHIENIGVIKDVSDNVVRIIRRERSY